VTPTVYVDSSHFDLPPLTQLSLFVGLYLSEELKIAVPLGLVRSTTRTTRFLPHSLLFLLANLSNRNNNSTIPPSSNYAELRSLNSTGGRLLLLLPLPASSSDLKHSFTNWRNSITELLTKNCGTSWNSPPLKLRKEYTPSRPPRPRRLPRRTRLTRN
jgi:hypothetical protein